MNCISITTDYTLSPGKKLSYFKSMKLLGLSQNQLQMVIQLDYYTIIPAASHSDFEQNC